MQAPERSPSARRRLFEGVARSQRWVQRQRSQRADTELGVFDFLVLCFEQIAIAGAAMNCFRSVSSSSSTPSSASAPNDNDSDVVFPETVTLLPLAILTMVVFSAVVVWVSPWLAGCCKRGCCCARPRNSRPSVSPSSRPPLCTTRRHAMPVITVVLKLTFLNYVAGMLGRSEHFALKRQLGDLLAALLLLLCELVDMFALLHTWWAEFRRARSDPLTVADVCARHEERMSARKHLVLTFFDRWKDCGTVSSFLGQNELLMLGAEVPSMAWAAWTACSIGSTPERLSYHVHRVLTMLTIIMGTFVLDQAPQLSPDIQGAVVFLVADVARSALSVYNGCMRQQRQATAAPPLAPTVDDNIGGESAATESFAPLPSNGAANAREDSEQALMRPRGPTDASTAASSPPRASVQDSSKPAVCLKLHRITTVLRDIPSLHWLKAAIDCIFVVNVVLNFFETATASNAQRLYQTSAAGSDAVDWQRLQNQVKRTVIVIYYLLGGILAISLAFRMLYAYASFSTSPSARWWRKMSCIGSKRSVQTQTPPHDYMYARKFELSVQCVKLVLVGVSIDVFGSVMVRRGWLVLKEGIDVLIAYMIGMIALANVVDAFGRALTNGPDGSSLATSPPTLMVEDGRVTVLAKLNTAIQVLWDRLNDFLCPLSLVHVLVDYSGDVTRNLIVFYLVLAVCVLHAVIAFLDRTDVTDTAYAGERFGYLVAISMVVLGSTHYVPRSGGDLWAPTQLVFINFAQLLVVLSPRMGKSAKRKQLEALKREFLSQHGDGRSQEKRAQARATLDKLQRKLDDDALREDGFWFHDGRYMDSRRARLTPGMKAQSYTGHSRRVSSVSVVTAGSSFPTNDGDTSEADTNHQLLFTFAADKICAWNFRSGQLLAAVETEALHAQSVCGAATFAADCGSTGWIWLAYASHQTPVLHGFDCLDNRVHPSKVPLSKPPEMSDNYCTGHQQQIACMAFSHHARLLATGSWDSTCMLWQVPQSTTATRHTQVPAVLVLLRVLPVDDSGVLSLAFAQDDSALITCGECQVKVWSLDDVEGVEARADTDNQSEEGAEVVKRLADKLTAWEDAIPYSFSAEYSLRLAEFDESLLSLVPNDGWTFKYEEMDSFHFEQLLDPAAGVSNLSSKDPVTRIDCILPWQSACGTDVNRRPRTFKDATLDGVFSRHTSTISGCSVAHELDMVVTVAYDRSVRFWRLSAGVVLETVRSAHAAPITCCALTRSDACFAAGIDMLLATGGSDNLVKVWRRGRDLATGSAECVYALSGHYDAVQSVAFDRQAVFLVSAGQDANVFTWRVRPSSPDTPDVPAVEKIDRFSITISWTEPLANGARISHYVVRTTQLGALPAAGSSLQRVPDVEVASKYSTATIDKLQPGVRYSLQLAAINSIGSSAFSALTAPVETLAFVPAKIDRPVQYSDRQASSIRLAWTPPCPNGAVLESYTIKCLPENSAAVPALQLTVPVADAVLIAMHDKSSESSLLEPVAGQTSSATGSNRGGSHKRKPKARTETEAVSKREKIANRASKLASNAVKDATEAASQPVEAAYVVEGLWPGEIYQFAVAAANRCGLGEFSRVSDYVKMASTAPDAPGAPTLLDVGKRQADVAWVKPRCNGSEILQYTLVWTQSEGEGVSEDEQMSTVLLAHSITGTRATLTGLLPGRPLRAWVSATNLIDSALCTSPLSPASATARTLCDVPDAPQPPPRLASASSHSLVLAWTPPVDNGLPIERYDVVLYHEESQFSVAVKRVLREFVVRSSDCRRHGEADVSVAIEDLRGGCFYSADLRAVNALGAGPASVCSAPLSTLPATVPASISSPPTVSDVTPTGAVLAWRPPVDDGGAPMTSVQVQFTSYCASKASRVLGGPESEEYRSDEEGEVDEQSLVDGETAWMARGLRPRRVYRFRVATRNAVGTAAFSPWSRPVNTPSLVEFTVATYFASRPPVEHAKARVLQRRYRAWKVAVAERKRVAEGLALMLRSWIL